MESTFETKSSQEILRKMEEIDEKLELSRSILKNMETNQFGEGMKNSMRISIQRLAAQKDMLNWVLF